MPAYDSEMVESDDIAADTDAEPPILANEDPNDKMGQLAAAVVTHFDYEADKTEYIIEVTDTDAEVAVGPVRVTITVMNVNEAPSAPMEQRGGLSVTGRENVMFDEILADDTSPDLMVGTYRGIGVDAANARWSLTGPDMGDFSIDRSTGEVTFRAAPNYEMPMDADTDNRYQITVVANDGTNDDVASDRDGGERGRRRDANPVGECDGSAHDGAAGWRHNNWGCDGPGRRRNRRVLAVGQDHDTMMDSWMDIAGAMDAAYTVMDADEGSPAGDGDVRRRGRRGQDGLGGDHDGDGHQRGRDGKRGPLGRQV